MLAADKAAIESVLRKNALQVRQKELDLYLSNFGTVATQAAMLAGFSMTGLLLDVSESQSAAIKMPWLRISFYLTTSATLGLMLLTVSNCTLCSIFGPSLALRGPTGSMDRATRILQLEQQWVFGFYAVGLISFHVSAIILAVIYFDITDAVVVAAFLVAFLILFFVCGIRIFNALKLDTAVDGQVVIGGYAVGEGEHEKAKLMGDKANGAGGYGASS